MFFLAFLNISLISNRQGRINLGRDLQFGSVKVTRSLNLSDRDFDMKLFMKEITISKSSYTYPSNSTPRLN
jgi:hypothetical protein